MSVVVAKFSVPGEPISKARARFTKQGSKYHSYTPEKTRLGEQRMAAHFRDAAPDHVINSTSSFAVHATFINGTRQRRDVDNMLKLILDSLNKKVWADDNQVVEVYGRKQLIDSAGGEPRTEVTILCLGEIEQRLAPCVWCGGSFTVYKSQSARKYCGRECQSAHLRKKRERTCLECQAVFHPKPGSEAKYCSRPCVSRHGSVIVSCTNCGVDFKRKKSWVKPKNFCSPSCQQDCARPVKAEKAKGTCSTCGANTSKKQYTNCQKCAIALVHATKKTNGIFPAPEQLIIEEI